MTLWDSNDGHDSWEDQVEIEARLAITSLMGRYTNTIDFGESSRWVECFTKDGSFVYFKDGAETPLVSLSGRAELSQFVEDLVVGQHDSEVMSHHHFGATEVLEESPTQLRLRTRATLSSTQDGAIASPWNGTYDDVVRLENGEWLFAERVLRSDTSIIAARKLSGPVSSGA